MNKTKIIGLIALVLAQSHIYADVSRLDWMQGSWGGTVGNAYLEESWSPPRAGVLTASVRFSSKATADKPAQVIFIELITITNADPTEDDDGGLHLYIQQFSPELEPRFPPQPMKMSKISERSVTFAATEAGGGISELTYSLSDDGQFNIVVDLVEGTQFVAVLEAI